MNDFLIPANFEDSGKILGMFSVRRGILTIKSGDCTYTIPVLDADNYPKIALPFPEDMLKIKGICTLYAKTANTVANKDTYPALAGIRLELYSDAIRAIGCDTFRMAIANMDCNCGGKLAVTIPKQSFFYLANAVTDADELQIGICDNSVVFMKEGLVFSTRCIPGSYLDIDRLISSSARTEIASVKGEDWRRVAETVSTITNIGGDTAPVELRIEQGELLVKIESQNASSTQGVSAAVKNMAGDVFYYPPKAITDAHKVVKGDIKLEMTGRGIMYLSNKTGMYMIMNTKKRSVREKKQPAKTKSQKTDVKKAA